MKKLIACLMAVMMLALPVVTMGESAQVTTMSIEADAQQMELLMKALFGTDGMGEDMAELLSSLSVQLWQQSDGMGYSANIQDTELASVSMFSSDGVESMVTSMLPGYVLTGAAAQSFDWSSAAELAAGLNFTETIGKLQHQLEAELDTLPIIEETGSFVGDAYSGGVRRITLRIDDAELSRIISGCLTALEHDSALEALFDGIGEDWQLNLNALNNVVVKAGNTNTYSYQVSAVINDQDVLNGLSFTAFEGDKQIATLSIGLNADHVEIVWGYGYGGVNYYLRIYAIGQQISDETTILSALVDVFVDPQGMGFSMVNSADGTKLEEYVMTVAVKPETDGAAFSTSVDYQQLLGETYTINLIGEGKAVLNPFDLDAEVKLVLNKADTPAASISFVTEPGEARVYDGEGLQAVDMDNINEDQAAELMDVYEKAGTELILTLFRLLPAQLLMPLLQY